MKMYVIGEIGTSHGGDRCKARDLIQALAGAGAQCAKFQVVLAHEILHPASGLVPLPSGPVALYQRFQALEQSPDFYAYLKEQTEKAGLDFLASPFGLQSARLLKDLGVRSYKVASPELNHRLLLEELASYQRPLILSSGVSTLADIQRTLTHLRRLNGAANLTLLHCVTAYPAPPQDYNLRVLRPLSQLLGVAVGVSDHSLDPILVPSLSVTAGAICIEKHVCLSRSDPGLDDPIALDPQGFSSMVSHIRQYESLSPPEQLHAAFDQWGKILVESVLGTGQKELAPSEVDNYGRTNRSLHALKDLKVGEALDWTNMAILRTEKVLRPGLDAWLYPQVLGARLHRGVESGQGIVWEDLLDLTNLNAQDGK